MKPSEFLAHVIRPTLAHLDLGGPQAETLLLGTALTESGLDYLKQISGPALGFYQCEPATHQDTWVNYLGFRGDLSALVNQLLAPRPDRLVQLQTNLAYATAICRIHYWRRPEPLPAWDDAEALATYHKQFYNSQFGATDPAESVEHFRRATETVRG